MRHAYSLAGIGCRDGRPIAARAATASGDFEQVAVRLNSPDEVLWRGSLRVGANRRASYTQSLSQASRVPCPVTSSHGRSERQETQFTVYAVSDGARNNSYVLDASWTGPIVTEKCGESGTRLVQVNQTVQLEPGESVIIDGDAGFRVEVSRIAR